MATVNLGSIKFKWKGTYAGGTAYTIDDVVSYNGSSYICIQASTGNLPTDTAYFEQMSSAGTNGTDLGTTLTTQGDIVYRDGSGLQRLPIGTANQILQVNSGATALEYTAKPEGKIVNMAYYENNTEYSNTNSTTYVTATNHSITYTPSATNNILFIEFMPNVRVNSGGGDCAFVYRIVRTPSGGSDTTFYEDTTNVESYYYDSSGGERLQFPRYFLHRDNTHNTTSALTYRVDFKNHHSAQQVYISNDSTISRWRITEVKP
jgi:hypothetical protein